MGLTQPADHLLILPLLRFSSLPPATVVTAAVLPWPHLFGEAVYSKKPQPLTPARHPTTPTAYFNTASMPAATIPAAFI